MDILLMDFKQNRRVENGHSKVEGGIRGRSYSNEKMDTKAKGAVAPDSSKSALLLNQHPFFIALVALAPLVSSSMVQRTAWTLTLVGLSSFPPLTLLSYPFPAPPSIVSFSFAFLYLLPPPPPLPTPVSLSRETRDEYSIMNERQNFR